MAVCFLDSWGAAVGSLRMIAELVSPMLKSHNILGEDSPFAQEWFVIIALSLIVFPMMLYRDITKLGWINILGIVSMMVFAATIVVKAILSGNNLEGRSLFEWNTDAVMAIPVIAFSFDCQVNVFGSYRDITGDSGNKSEKLITASLIANASAAASYVIIALSGYVTYLGSTSGDVMGNLPSTLDAVKIIFGLSVLFSFPVILLECSTIVQEHVIRPLLSGGYAELDDEEVMRDDEEDEIEQSHAVNICTNLFIIVSAGVVAAFVPSMYAAFAYVGATTATANTAIIPPLYYLMTVKRHYPGFSILGKRHTAVDTLHRDRPAVQSNNQQEDNDSDTETLPSHADTDHDDSRTVDLVAGPPNQWFQRLALVYLICGCITVPTLVYVTTINS
eukprot:TRINITY_DN2380_c0_g1_i1.p1 TRINITY_DN2380_c0_g1~~TRINITY_DN2380_c0_g1_i1.p1  ORF type:complete len:453 (+),score=51.27 TRINITY_DN2380_c0_g1_i1:191-1360(+)